MKAKYLPNIWGAIFILLSLLFAQVLIISILLDLGINFDDGDPTLMFASVFINGVFSFIVVRMTGLPIAEILHSSANSIQSTLILLAGPIFMVILGAMWWFTDLIEWITASVPKDQKEYESLLRILQGGLPSFIILVVLAPLIEEILFRGVILRGFLFYYPASIAIIGSSLLFALVHINIFQIPSAFLLGSLLAWLYYLSKSLWPSIFCHALYNAGVFIFFNINHREGGDPLKIVYHSFSTNFLSFLLSAFGIYIIWRLFNRR